jgi:hypothetical protein
MPSLPAVSTVVIPVDVVLVVCGVDASVADAGSAPVPVPLATGVGGSGVWQAARKRPEAAIIGIVRRESMTAWPDKGMETGTAAP